tara:strand:+ start:1578 stop:2735 length:1158 start_codon:yes stop_codon:yes gene_type:complete
MAKLLKLRGGTTSQHGSFTGADREVTVDTDKETLVVHNGSQAGGFPLARADGTGTSNFTITGEIDAATLDISGNGDVAGTLNAGALTVDNITIDGTEIDLSSGDLTLDVAGDIILDADGADVSFRDGGTGHLSISNSSNDAVITSLQTDKDMIFKGVDGGSTITALTLDMSDAGNATFNGTVTANAGLKADNITIDGTEIDLSSGDLTVDVAGDIILDVDGGDVHFQDDGSSNRFMTIKNSSGNAIFSNTIADGDITFQGNDAGVGAINALILDMSASGAATFNNNVTAFSDERLKDNIETIDGGLAKVLSMRGVNYTRDGKDNVGVIAQEVEKVLPEIVLTANDEMGTKSVDYGRITAVLIEAIKELKTQIDAKCDCDCECKGE